VPFCPQCREEYRAGFAACADCGAPLVDALPAEPERSPEAEGGSHGGWDQAAEAGQVYEAELMAMRLRAAGIEAEVVDQTFHQEPMPNVRSFAVVRVLVPVERVEEARRVLAEGLALPEDAEVETDGNPTEAGEK
jgi:hypothetical protein